MALSVLLAMLVSVRAQPNMNGEYLLSRTPGSNPAINFSTTFSAYPGGVEYFDVYTPNLTLLYSQVFWTRLPSVPLPSQIVSRFAGKAMAVVGFEIDQVRRTVDGDVSLPINVVYNHHFEATMLGSNTVMEKIKLNGPDDPRVSMHGHARSSEDEAWVVREIRPGSLQGASQSLNFGGSANGGEYRKSFHGLAPGFAQVIESPELLSVEPMQIDTWNRDKMDINGGPFVPGPVPRNSLAPTVGPDAKYSGLLECPVTTRLSAVVHGAYTSEVSAACNDSVTSSSECFAAAGASGLPPNTRVFKDVGSSESLPSGCNIIFHSNQTATFFFNTLNTTQPCGGTSAPLLFGSTTSLVTLNVSIDPTADVVTITMTGPIDVWFGVGLDASSMSDAPYAVIIDGLGQPSEHRLANHLAGHVLTPSVKVVASTVTGKLRTVVMTRPMKGLTDEHYSFSLVGSTTIPFINAIGSTSTLAYHAAKTAAQLTLFAVDQPTCLCAHQPAPFGNAKGVLRYEDGSTVGFGNQCVGQLLDERNPTCDLRTYAGGQIACHHMWSLLDADQDIPWPDQPVEFALKFRFYYQPYNESVHQNIRDVTWGMASPVEYDIPQCPKGTPTEKCIHTLTRNFKAPADVHLVAAHFHCHAPTCLSVSLYRNATGELLCRSDAVYGAGRPDVKADEEGFIAVPPCLWGSPTQGFELPPDVGGQVLTGVKTSNSTYGHHGEMAWLQMKYV